MFTLLFVTLLLASLHGVAISAAAGPKVTLDYGTFHGARDDATQVVSYKGIRYADAPVGEHRWRAPVSPPTQHLGDVDATKFGNRCIQATQTQPSSGASEDCLFGNVYVPITNSTNGKLPVMVWFHGGGFQGGSTHDVSPNMLLHTSQQKVVFVSFEYRLGQFGFLGGSDVQRDGVLNAGLLDQRSALRWVQRYISKFGGDPKRVTIWGQSAGAGSTMFHLLGNGGNNEGLFRAAMGDSPSINFLPSFNDPYPQTLSRQFASFAGCGNSTNVMGCLRAASSAQLTSAGGLTINARPATLFAFAPIIDGSFLKERPVEAFTAGHFAHVPVLFGSNSDEGANWSASLRDASANTSMPNATETTVYNFIRGQFASFTDASFERAVREFYPLSDYRGSLSLQGQQMYGEMRYICSAVLITSAAHAQGLQAFHYHYNNPTLGSTHSAELAAFFGSTPADGNDKKLFQDMRDLWTSFVASGRPTARDQPSGLWKPVDSTEGSPRILLQPGEVGLESVNDALASRCAFWHGLARELNM